MKRILYINKDGFIGGSAISLLLLLKKLPQDKYKFKVILCSKGPFQNLLEKEGIEYSILDFKEWRKAKRIFKNIIAIFKLQKIIKKERIDIVHANSYEVNPLIIFAGRKIKKICHLRDFISEERAKKYLLHRADVVIAVSRAVAEAVKNIVKNIKVVYNGIDLEEVKKAKNKIRKYIKESKKGKVFVGTVGNCEPRKRWEDFIKAGVNILKKDKKFRFILIGKNDTDYCKKIIRLIPENFRCFFYFTGHVNNVFEIIKGLDILVITSESESFCRAIAEAMACAIPVIATKTGGIPEVVAHKKTGYLIPPRNLSKLSNLILKLGKDIKKRKKLGKEGYMGLKKLFLAERYVREVINIYEN